MQHAVLKRTDGNAICLPELIDAQQRAAHTVQCHRCHFVMQNSRIQPKLLGAARLIETIDLAFKRVKPPISYILQKLQQLQISSLKRDGAKRIAAARNCHL